MIETLGGYSNLYLDPFVLVEIPVSVPVSLIRAYPTAPEPKEGIAASIAYNAKFLPFNGASLKMKLFPSIHYWTFGINNRPW